MSFFHSQNVIDPEFFFPAFYDETVCIKQEDDCKDSDHTDSQDCFLMRT